MDPPDRSRYLFIVFSPWDGCRRRNSYDFTVNEIPSLGSLHLPINCSSNNPINNCLLNTYFVLGSVLCTGDTGDQRDIVFALRACCPEARKEPIMVVFRD